MKTIFRTARIDRYTQISNLMLRDKSLSLKAKGLLAMILSHTDEWVVTKSWLESVCLEGREAILSAMKELQAAGYAKLEEQGKDSEGKFSTSVWTFFEEANSAVDGFPVHGSPVNGKPATKKTVSSEDCKITSASPKAFPKQTSEGPNNLPAAEASVKTQPPNSGRSPSQARQPFSELGEAFALECGKDPKHMAREEWGVINRALGSIRKVDPTITPEGIRIAMGNFRKLNNWMTGPPHPMKVSGSWSQIRPGTVVQDVKPTAATLRQQIEFVKDQLAKHPANFHRKHFVEPSSITDEQKADYKALSARLKSLEGQQ